MRLIELPLLITASLNTDVLTRAQLIVLLIRKVIGLIARLSTWRMKTFAAGHDEKVCVC